MKRNGYTVYDNLSNRIIMDPWFMLYLARNLGRNVVVTYSVHDRKNARPVFEYSAPGEETTRMTAGEFWYQVFCMIENDGADDETIYEYASNCRVI